MQLLQLLAAAPAKHSNAAAAVGLTHPQGTDRRLQLSKLLLRLVMLVLKLGRLLQQLGQLALASRCSTRMLQAGLCQRGLQLGVTALQLSNLQLQRCHLAALPGLHQLLLVLLLLG